MQGAGGKQHQAQGNFCTSQPGAHPLVAPGAHHSLGKVQPHHQADPAVGVHAVFKQPRQGYAKGQGLEHQPRSPGAYRCQKQLPGNAQRHQRQQAASGQPARGGNGRVQVGLGCCGRCRGGGGRGCSHWGGIISTMHPSLELIAQRLRDFVDELSRFPWKTTALTLRERFREDSLGMRASSLTFTTVLAMVPFFVVALAVFTAFPIFGKLQDGLQRWLIESLVPDSIARQVLGYLTQFSSKASRLGTAGFTVLVVTVLALVLGIDRTLNAIWRVRRLRPLGQRVLIYWAVLTLGPLVLGASLAFSSYVMSASGGLVRALPGGLRFVLDVLEFAALAAGLAAIYHYVPNTPVKWRHAWVGGLLAAVCIELAKQGLGLYLSKVPTYSVVYGAFATVPILLVWIYVAWVMVLMGAVVTAYLPSLLMGVARRGLLPGWSFQLAIEVLQALHQARHQDTKGLRSTELARALQIDSLQLTPVLDALVALDWVAQISDAQDPGAPVPEQRWLLLIDPAVTPLEPLVQRMLLTRTSSLVPLWASAGLGQMKVLNAIKNDS